MLKIQQIRNNMPIEEEGRWMAMQEEIKLAHSYIEPVVVVEVPVKLEDLDYFDPSE